MKTIKTIITAAGLLWSAMAGAQAGEQLYFFAQAAPLGSLSSEGAAAQAVYLRWDVQEGRLPPALQRLVITRDGEDIHTAPAEAIMAGGQIQALYDGPGQSRRKAEMLRRLNAEAMSEGGAAISPGALGNAVAARLMRDNLWGFLASRLDFNVARARHRGYLDRPGAGVFSYELLAEDGNGNRRRLGLITVNTAQPRFVAAPLALQQLIQGRCDAPEGALDDGAVSLFWRHGGAGSTDQMANSLQISGYDIWRSARPLAANATTVPALDLRALAAGSAHGSGGEIAIDGMLRVNDEPVLLTSDDSGLITAQYVQQAVETAAGGQAPGTRWAYYVVPRDFTGHYGPAAGIVVEIPDRLVPPAPWGLEPWEQPGSGELALEWEAIELDAYMRTHNDGRSFCNVDAVRRGDTARLSYVPAGEGNCTTGRRQTVNLGIGSFRVYRFDNFEAASRFTDADGDGVSDLDERSLDGPGTACDASAQPNGAPNARVDHPQSAPIASVIAGNGRTRMVFRDALPAQQRGNRYWYRVAAVGSNGRVSPMSAPVRGFVPDRVAPEMPGEDVVRLVGPPGCLAYEVAFVPGKAKGDNRVVDSAGVADAVTASCVSGQAVARFPFPGAPNGQRQEMTLTADQCQTLADACGDVAVLGFVRGDRRFASGAISGLSECSGILTLRGVNPNPQVGGNACSAETPIQNGQALDEPPRIFVNTNECVSVYRDFGRQPGSSVDGSDSYRLGTWCQPDPNQPLDLSIFNPEPGTPICLSVALQNQNARVSPRRRLQCFSLNVEQTPPPTPTPVGLGFSGNDADVSWIPSLSRSSATIIELYRSGGGSLPLRTTAPHPGARASDGARSTTLELPPPPAGSDWREEWCMRLVAIGQGLTPQAGRVLSEPSAPLCAERLPAGSAPSVYLPWPAVDAPPTLAQLQVGYYADEDAVLVRLSDAPFVMNPDQAHNCEPVQPVLRQCGVDPDKEGLRCLDDEPVTLSCLTPVQDSFCRQIRAAAAPNLGFVAWRQSRPIGGGLATDFVQVSPLIDQVHCDLELFPAPFDARVFINRLRDPYVQLIRAPDSFGNAWSGQRLAFLDRYPHRSGREYRYEFVYFDARGEISATRTSAWVTVP